MTHDLQQQASRRLITRCLDELQLYLDCANPDPDAPDEAHWLRLFGKESVVGALSKLVAMQKQLAELAEREAATSPADNAPIGPMQDADWDLLELCLARRREGRGAA